MHVNYNIGNASSSGNSSSNNLGLQGSQWPGSKGVGMGFPRVNFGAKAQALLYKK